MEVRSNIPNQVPEVPPANFTPEGTPVFPRQIGEWHVDFERAMKPGEEWSTQSLVSYIHADGQRLIDIRPWAVGTPPQAGFEVTNFVPDPKYAEEEWFVEADLNWQRAESPGAGTTFHNSLEDALAEVYRRANG